MGIFNQGLIVNIISGLGMSSQDNKSRLLIFSIAIAVMIASYAFGSFSSAIIVSKALYKEDIRTHGSGNAGLTNMLRTYGKGAAALTLIGDMLKTALAIGIAALIFGINYNNGISISGICYLSGLCAVLGHVYPVFYGFKGGKGVLVTATMALILSPIIFVTLLSVFIIIVIITRYVSLGSIIVASLFPVAVCTYSYFIGGALPVLTVICTVALGIFVVWCHRSNIKRLLTHTEKKISVGKKEKKG